MRIKKSGKAGVLQVQDFFFEEDKISYCRIGWIKNVNYQLL